VKQFTATPVLYTVHFYVPNYFSQRDALMSEKIKKPFIEPGCISCGSCQFIAPEIFEVTDRSRVRNGANFETHAELIEKAARACPVQVIKISHE
jgi:ferredoxin